VETGFWIKNAVKNKQLRQSINDSIESHSARAVNNRGLFKKRLLLILGLVVALYSGVWFVLAHILYVYAGQELQQLDAQGRHVDCENLRKMGYPLRLGLICDALNWQDETGRYLAMGELVASAPIYAPSWRRVEINAPALLEMADFGRLEAAWQSFILTANFVDEHPVAAGLAIEDFRLEYFPKSGNRFLDKIYGKKQRIETQISDSIKSQSALDLTNIANIDDIQLQADFIHVQLENKAEQVTIALSFDTLRLPTITGYDSSDDLTVTGEVMAAIDLPSADKMDFRQIMHGRTGQLEKFQLQFSSGGGVSAEGDVYIADSGVVSGQLNVHLLETSALLRTARLYFPDQIGNLESLFFLLNTMPKDAQGNPTITINIKEGQMRAGFIPLGNLPSL